MFKNDELRLICKSLAISCDAILKKMDRMGKQAELLQEYERTDSLLIKMRMALLESIKANGVVATRPAEKPVDDETPGVDR